MEFEDRYECHIDKVDPNKDPLGHLVNDSSGTLASIIVGIAALAIGGGAYYFYKKKQEKEDEEEEI